MPLDRGRRGGRVARVRLREQIFGHLIVVDAASSDFYPDIVAAARRDHREMLAREFGRGRQLVLDRAELCERVLNLGRQQLTDDAVDRFESETYDKRQDERRGVPAS
jgi:hypothetical protein